MLRLGTKVRIDGLNALIVARTLTAAPKYDLRLSDGRIIKYASEADFESMETAEQLAAGLCTPRQGGILDTAGRR
ncbi:hypothetical protein [Azospirillum sp. SYSU D00513]|uniref:hypothetical protein n=1 Tax=Azospirillum sp. SYSU D00513 TaxID=2812561 RepID=UPI001A9789FB|nr:hypothetical protein [Azospirillum sp. SYSU D00513]